MSKKKQTRAPRRKARRQAFKGDAARYEHRYSIVLGDVVVY